jgi:drug/metabolite transporter (DMT)-like permease
MTASAAWCKRSAMTFPAVSLLNARSKINGYLFAAAGASLFSTKAIFIKLAYQEQVNASLMLAYRMAFSLPVFAAVGVWAYRAKRANGEPMPEKQTVLLAVATGFIGYYLSALFDFSGLQYISAHLERLLLFTYPLFVMFIGVLFMGEKLTRHGVAAAAVTYAGLGIVLGLDLTHGGRDTLIGAGLVLAAAISFATYQILAKRTIALMGAALFTSVSLSASSVMCVLHHIVIGGGSFAASPRFIWLCAGCAAFATVLPSFLINGGLARISSEAVAMISTVSPIVTIVLAVTILGEPFTPVDALGSALVLAGVGIYTWGDSRAL